MSLLENEFNKISNQLAQSSKTITGATTSENFAQLLTQAQEGLKIAAPTSTNTDPLFPLDSPLNSALSGITATIKEKTLSLQHRRRMLLVDQRPLFARFVAKVQSCQPDLVQYPRVPF